MEEKEISFITIPAEVFRSKELTLAEKYIYGYLSIFKKQCCFQSNSTISEGTGISEPTVSRALKSLSDKKYIFIEFINGNNAKRRIYVIFDNPKKLKYLVSKGLFSESNQNDETVEKSVENLGGSNQNDKTSNQNDKTQNRGESNQNDYHRIIYKKDSESESPSGLESRPSGTHKPYRSDFENQEDYVKALYAWQG